MLLSSRRLLLVLLVPLAVSPCPALGQQPGKDKLFPGPLNIEPKPIAKDGSVKYDFDIVYVRAPRKGDTVSELGGGRRPAQPWSRAPT